MRLNSTSTTQARCQIVAEHIGRENEHNLDGILATFGEAARYDDEPWDAHYVGLQEVRTFYTQLLQALPDLHIDVIRQHVADHVIVVEVNIRGRHMGPRARASGYGPSDRVSRLRDLHVRSRKSVGR